MMSWRVRLAQAAKNDRDIVKRDENLHELLGRQQRDQDRIKSQGYSHRTSRLFRVAGFRRAESRRPAGPGFSRCGRQTLRQLYRSRNAIWVFTIVSTSTATSHTLIAFGWILIIYIYPLLRYTNTCTVIHIRISHRRSTIPISGCANNWWKVRPNT